MNPIVVIPARMGSLRLPGKPLADINGTAMVVRVYQQALKAGLPVIAACDDEKIKQVIEASGGVAIMTSAMCQSGSDRVFEAIETHDPQKTHDFIINLQGDLPTVTPEALKKIVEVAENYQSDIVTLAAKDDHNIENPNVVKIAATMVQENLYRAHYFSRSPIPHGSECFFHHIGIYGFHRPALEKFVKLSPSPLEKQERLEQLRALENDMTIAFAVVDQLPLGVDTESDLNAVRKNLA